MCADFVERRMRQEDCMRNRVAHIQRRVPGPTKINCQSPGGSSPANNSISRAPIELQLETAESAEKAGLFKPIAVL